MGASYWILAEMQHRRGIFACGADARAPPPMRFRKEMLPKNGSGARDPRSVVRGGALIVSNQRRALRAPRFGDRFFPAWDEELLNA